MGSWMAGKLELLNSPDVGEDDDAAVKLLTRHEAPQLEVDTCSGLTNEIGNMANVITTILTAKSLPNVSSRSQGMKNLQKLASHRRRRLVDSTGRHYLH